MADAAADHIGNPSPAADLDRVCAHRVRRQRTPPTARPSPRRAGSALALIVALAAVVILGCGGDADEGAETSTTPPTSTTDASPPLQPTPGSSPTPAPTVAPTPTATGSTPERPALADPTTCTNPEAGYTVDHPSAWSTNDGDVVAACSLFGPEPFGVPEATDERVAPISVFRENVAFSDLPVEQGAERALTVVDGFQAVRVEGIYDGEGLYPAGTRFTSYRIDLAPGVDDGAGTLLADVIDVGDIDYDEAQRTLDLMIRTLVIGIEADTEPAAVGVFEGGGTPVTVLASLEDQVCFSPASDTIDGGDRPCVDPREVQARGLGAPSDVTVGTAPGDVFRIEAVLAGSTISALPVPVQLGAGAYAWALPVPLDRIEQLRWYDIDGNELGAT